MCQYNKKDNNYVFYILIWTLPLWNWVFVINLLFLNESFNPRIPGGKVRFIYRVLHESRLHLNIWSTKNEFSFIQKTKKKWVFSCILFDYTIKVLIILIKKGEIVDWLPIEGSSINPFTFFPVERTIIVAAPYKAYPAATSSLPGFKTSFSMSAGSTPDIVFRLYMANIDPTDTKHSMLFEPSKGSKHTTYDPFL